MTSHIVQPYSSWLVAVEFYVGWRISSYFVKITLFAHFIRQKTNGGINISSGMVENSKNGDSRSLIYFICHVRVAMRVLAEDFAI